MDDEHAQARSGSTTPDVANAGRGGRNPTAQGDGAESFAATAGRTKAEVATQLMEQVVERGNMWKAYERVVRNKGAPGADGMRVDDLKVWLQAHWQSVKAALLGGSYLPREVRAVDNGTDEAGTDEGTRVAFGDQRARCLVELRSQPHERGLPEVLLRPHGTRVAGGYSPALPASRMNRRMRNRTYGGVGGRRGNPSSYPMRHEKRQLSRQAPRLSTALSTGGSRLAN